MLGYTLSFLRSTAQDYYEGPHPKQDKSIRNDSPNKGFNISISAGTSVPFKSFSSVDVKNSFWDFTSNDSVKLQGFAKTGIHVNITASYLFANKVGLMALFGNNSNAFDIFTFSNKVGVPFITSDKYHIGEYMIGPYCSFPFSSKFTFEANAMIGLVTANYPALSITIVDTTETIAFNSGKCFGYGFGGLIKYNITGKIAVSVNAAYFQAKMTYPGWSQVFTLPGYYPVVIRHDNDETSMPMGMLQITAGITFRFH